MEKKGKEVQQDFRVEESNDQLPAVSRKLKRKAKCKKLKYIRWGSEPLIKFFESIGKSTDQQLSQLEVTRIINEYINLNNLIHPSKKKKVECDEWLENLFKKKKFARNKIYEMLEEHFTENNDDSEEEEEEEEEVFYCEYEKEDDIMSCKWQKVLGSEKKASREKKQESEKPKSIFAAIIRENIKLLYLKRSLVEDLVKDYESFESKVVGSYVRIKSDPNDISQKNSHQLLQVTGVNKDPVCDDPGKGVLLQVKNSLKDISISMLSDANFSKEECEDLRERLKASSLTMPTVVELEEKAKILHEDITKHWIPKELALLENLRDQANEKGWRREYFTFVEHSERMQLLMTPAEKSRLLAEVPKITAEVLEPDPTLLEPTENVKEENNSNPNSVLGGATDISVLGAHQRVTTENSLNIVAVGSKDADDQAHFSLNSSANKAGKIDSINGLTSVQESEGIHASVGQLKEDNKIVSKDAVYKSHFTSSSSGKNKGKTKITNSVKESEGQSKKDNKIVDRKQKKRVVNSEERAHIQHPPIPMPWQMPVPARAPFPAPMLAPPITMLPWPMLVPPMDPDMPPLVHVLDPVQAPPYVPLLAPPLAPPSVPVPPPAPVYLRPPVLPPFIDPRAMALAPFMFL